ncbi:hypothetical protein Tco_0496302 [Tanacetum coccineum]
MFMHTARDDTILGTMRLVYKFKDFQIYGVVLPNRMTNPQIRDSNAYKSYLTYVIGASSPKMKRKLKKPASPSKKRDLVTVEEEEPKPSKKVIPTKKPTTKRQSSGVQFQDTPGVSVSKKKAPAKVAQVRELIPNQRFLISKRASDNRDEDADDHQGDDERTESDDEPTKTDNPKASDDEE